jgi:hypothetical protein
MPAASQTPQLDECPGHGASVKLIVIALALTAHSAAQHATSLASDPFGDGERWL